MHAATDPIEWSARMLIYLHNLLARRRHIDALHRDLETALSDGSSLRDFSLIRAEGLREEIEKQQRLLEADRDAARMQIAHTLQPA